VRRLITADWLKTRRYWLSWTLLGLMIVILVLQVNGKIDQLAELEAALASGAEIERSPFEPQAPAAEAGLLEVEWLRENLRYPAFIGYAARLATNSGWFFLILLTAVMGGEDFTRGTLRSLLTRGIGRGRYLMARCLTFWLVAGVGVLAVTLLAVTGGPYVHSQATDDPISLEGLGEALLVPVRFWLACLPYITATLFLVVLARQAGPAVGVGIGLRAMEILSGLVLPIMEILISSDADVPLIFRLETHLFSVTIGYSAEIFVNWGRAFTEAALTASKIGLESDMPASPWRAVAFLAGYTILFLGGAMWVLRRRDITYKG
jgi:ABC-type transport system involved in multi-copper enzyme maturation permease subunit